MKFNWEGTNNKLPLKIRPFIKYILYGKILPLINLIGFIIRKANFHLMCFFCNLTEVYKSPDMTEELYVQFVRKALQKSRVRIANIKQKKRKQDERTAAAAPKINYFHYD